MKRLTNGLLKRFYVLLICTACVSACGGSSGSSGGSGGSSGGDACSDVAGTWEGTVNLDGTDCGWETDQEDGTTQIAQTDCTLTLDMDGVQLQGQVSGSQIAMSGSFEEDGGTFTVRNSSTLQLNGEQLSGVVEYDFNDGERQCVYRVSVNFNRTSRPDVTTPTVAGLGDSCTSDSSCGSNMRCIIPPTGGSTGNCSIPCTSSEVCGSLSGHSQQHILTLPAEHANSNAWNTGVLYRGWGCYDVRADTGNPSDVVGDSYCYFICGEYAAMVFSEDGSVASCSCWPNFTWTDQNDRNNCAWDDSQECSVFKPCVAAVTTDERCEGDLSCIAEDDLEGTCHVLRTGAQIEACVQRCSADSCDGLCLSNCSGTPEQCVNSCCAWSC